MANNQGFEDILKPEYILKNYKNLTPDQLAIAISTNHLAPSVLAVVSKLNDNQLKIVVPLMSLEQVQSMVPKLQLEKNEVVFQAMNPAQVRKGISSLTSDDRAILMQNIALLTSSSSKDELQSFMAFIDPLAMCIAVGIPELCSRLVAAAGVMTHGQLRVVTPMIDVAQIRTLLTVLEDEAQIEVVMSMIDRKDDLCTMLIKDLPNVQKAKDNLAAKNVAIGEQLPELEKRVQALSTAGNKEAEYEAIVKSLKSRKSEVEALQQNGRELQASIKVPLKLLSPSEHSTHLSNYQQLSTQVIQLSKELYTKFSLIDSVINKLNDKWRQVKPDSTSSPSKSTPTTQEADAFEDESIATALYIAVKAIGNPDAVGNHYPMSWSQIIQAGFRSVKDFQDRGIQNLEQLQRYIDTHSTKT